jgi:DMSO reductase family type II enzyme heme b subunit
MTDRALSGGAWRRSDLAVAAAVVVAVLAAAALPTLTAARPANEVPVASVDGSAADASAEAWADVPAVTMATTSAPSGLPGASNVSTTRARLQVARNDTHAFVRISWADHTADRNGTGPRSFVDAVAVQLPANESARPPIAMGGTNNPVNVWYWSGDGTTEELLAGGAGTTTTVDSGAVEADAARGNDTWHVTFTRELAAEGNRTDLTVDRDVDVAVAVWNGSYGERAGRKAVSDWHYLALGPGPQGPPYEAILWTVAGLAVLFVTVVTIEGVRRTRESGGEPA